MCESNCLDRVPARALSRDISKELKSSERMVQNSGPPSFTLKLSEDEKGCFLTGANVSDKVANALGRQEGGEEAGPVRLDGHASSLHDGGDLVRGDGDLIIRKDESRVGASQLAVRHIDRLKIDSAPPPKP
eukprot:1187746-Prorocentrum_minimum.AAC.3